MSNVGRGNSGAVYTGKGSLLPASFLPIGTFSGLTDNGVVISNGAGAFTATNSGAAGQLLQSGGNADPAYTTATYPSTTTINQLLYSSAANTITGLANGTTGQVLIATTGSAPSWGAVPSSFAPNSLIQIVEDFIGTGPPGGNTNQYGQLNWFANVAWTVDATIGDAAHNGVIANASIAANDQNLFLNGQSPANAIAPQMIVGGGAITLNFVIKAAILSNVTNTYTLRVGFGVTANADQVNGVYFEYTNAVNSGNWQFKTASASSRTTSNSTIAVWTSYVNLGITINAAGTSCAFTANGVSLGAAIVATIPSVAITPFIDVVRSAGTIAAQSVLVDLMYFTQTLTTPR